MSFKPIICLLLERFASVVLVQTLAKRWCNITHTFHIADREMTITPHYFHYMTGLRFDGVSISLEGDSSTQLGLELFGRRYATETIRYIDLEADFMCRPQVTAEEYAKMAKVFLLYLPRTYFFANGGQTVSLRWLALFGTLKGCECQLGVSVLGLLLFFLGHA